MKKILIILLLLISFNVKAYNDATICSYNIDNKIISITYYESNNESVVTSFTVDGKNYENFENKLTSDFVVNNYNTSSCPVVSAVEFIGAEKIVYFITDNLLSFQRLVYSGDLIYRGDDPTEIYGQISKPSISKGSIYNYKLKLYGNGDRQIAGGAFFDEAEKLDDSVENYISSDCTIRERTVISDYLLENSFFGLSTFDMNYRYQGEDVRLSSTCVNRVDTLKDNLIVVQKMLEVYENSEGDTNTLSYLYLKGSYQNAYAYLHSVSYDLTGVEKQSCDLIGSDVVEILNVFFDSFRIVCIVLIVFMIYLDGMKCLTAKDDSATKKWISSSIKRLVVLVLVLLLPFIVNLIIDLLNLYFSSDYVSIDGECVKVITGG